MTLTKVKLASMALVRIGANTINDFNEGTNEADAVNLYYDAFLMDIFSRAPWSFALSRVRANRLIDTPINEYRYMYRRPSGMQYLNKVYSETEINMPSTPHEWTVVGENIYANYDNIVVEGTYIVNESLWPGYFIKFAIHALAAYVAMPLGRSEQIQADVLTQAYGTPSMNGTGGFFKEAVNVDSMQKPPNILRDNSILQWRFS